MQQLLHQVQWLGQAHVEGACLVCIVAYVRLLAYVVAFVFVIILHMLSNAIRMLRITRCPKTSSRIRGSTKSSCSRPMLTGMARRTSLDACLAVIIAFVFINCLIVSLCLPSGCCRCHSMHCVPITTTLLASSLL